MRVAKHALIVLVGQINRLAGTPQAPFTTNEGGGLRANVGCFHVTVPYRGRYALECIVNENGGCRTVIPTCTKLEMYHRLTAFISGMEVKTT